MLPLSASHASNVGCCFAFYRTPRRPAVPYSPSSSPPAGCHLSTLSQSSTTFPCPQSAADASSPPRPKPVITLRLLFKLEVELLPSSTRLFKALMGFKASIEDPHNVLKNWDQISVDPCS
ncbi:hypothetical protein ZIOFF_071141 [Zingiber officinale]|uniref:Leucine-rich repeat-containing N-terminal plant-type domain-containing protein n=1 Tax=Zingiber officinale TaxID=94328 RepID=A0A8J5EB92_ZINOF|nr:hypothetical protein ZIOFF_071141 [Zingiber officinale]